MARGFSQRPLRSVHFLVQVANIDTFFTGIEALAAEVAAEVAAAAAATD